MRKQKQYYVSFSMFLFLEVGAIVVDVIIDIVGGPGGGFGGPGAGFGGPGGGFSGSRSSGKPYYVDNYIYHDYSDF